ncbi:MAG: DUF2092 domain-containing protein [Mesorhizobium sp.]|nr:MAG: DUF2092 domain-containing protein [Mesorhizobium sp.]
MAEAIACAVTAVVVLSSPARAESDDARKILKAMSDYVGAQKSFSFTYQSSVEAVTNDMQKLEFVSSGTLTAERPDKVRLTRTGGFADVELVFDGKTLSIEGKNLKAYATVEAKGTLEDLAETLSNAGIEPPAADLFSPDSYSVLGDDTTQIKHIGSAFVDGVECDYLAARGADVDWQLWIQSGDKPIPLRYVITSKDVVQAPQYTLQISDWKVGGTAAGDFAFKAPDGFKQVDIGALESIDEVPSPAE